MARRQPSTIDRLPGEVREKIGALRQEGRTIDEIMDKLRELDVDVSRSALGRHVKGLAEIGERMRRSRDMAQALVARFGEEPDNRVARLNIELMHGLLFETLTAAGGSDDDQGGDEAQPVTLAPQQVKYLAEALKSLSSAAKVDADRMIKVRLEVAKTAAASAEKVMKARGLSAETIEAISHAVLGVAA